MMPLTGRWRIVEMEMWDRDAIDLVEPGFMEFAHDGTGQFGWAALVEDATIEGRLFIHLGDDSRFRAEPFARADQQNGR